MLPVHIIDLIAASGVIVLGATLQAATGLGAGLVMVPLLALIDPLFVPGPAIFASMALTALMSYRGRHEYRIAPLNTIVFGMIVGALAAASVLPVIQTDHAGVVIGVLILLAVAVSVRGFRVASTRRNQWLAGGLAGFSGTVAAIGAPILALLYQDEPGARVRAILAYLYLTGSCAALVVLFATGNFRAVHMLLGACLVPAFLVGYAASARLAAFLDRGHTRTAILIISASSALILIGRSVMA